MFEYKVVPAPKRGKRGKGVRGSDGKFAHALETVMNEMGAQGWCYLRTDTLPSEERQGLTGRTTVFQNMLVFHRAVPAEDVLEENDSTAPAPLAIEDHVEETLEETVEETIEDTDDITAQSSPDEPGDYDGPDLNSALKTRVDQVKGRDPETTD